MSDGPVPGWYADPEQPGGERYWDGSSWTPHRRPSAAAAQGSPWGAGATAGATGTVDVWLWQSIVATILCCQPLGIVAIVRSAQAGSARDAGNIVVARQRAEQARTWTLASVGVGVLFVGGFLLLAILGSAASA
ncbi:MAG: CD225/dispanin family protein [Nitriliruptor sp.]